LYITQFYNQINFFITLINGGDIDGGDLTCIPKKCYILSIKKQKPAFLQLKWTYTTTSPKQSIPWPPNIRGFKVDNTYMYRKCSKKRPIWPWAFSEETSNTVHNLHFTGSINNGVWRNNMGPLHGNKHQ
jgi:hypothetical protein